MLKELIKIECEPLKINRFLLLEEWDTCGLPFTKVNHSNKDGETNPEDFIIVRGKFEDIIRAYRETGMLVTIKALWGC